MRAWRRETLASGSSVSRSTSGKMPPSASQRPMCDSSSHIGNSLPTERPRWMTSLACGTAEEPWRGDELSPCSRVPARPTTEVRVGKITCDCRKGITSAGSCLLPARGCSTGSACSAAACAPDAPPSPAARVSPATTAECASPAAALPPSSDVYFLPDEVPGRLAPHSSQYCEPSIFSVWHLSQVIMAASLKFFY